MSDGWLFMPEGEDMAVSATSQVRSRPSRMFQGEPPGRKPPGPASPFSARRSLQATLDDAFARSKLNPLEEWLGGLLGRLRR